METTLPALLVLSQIPAEKSSVSLEFFSGLEFFPIFYDNRRQGQEISPECIKGLRS
jgi:hypothetical protein